MYDDPIWNKNRTCKPDDDDLCLVRDRDHRFFIAQYDEEERLWRDSDWNVIDVIYWIYIPGLED